MKSIYKYNFAKILTLLAVSICLITLSDNNTYAQNSPPLLNQPGYYNMHLGDFEIIALSDGTVPQDLNKLIIDSQKNEVKAQLQKSFLSTTIETSINTFLIKSNDKLILIDAGTSDFFGPNLGHLVENLNKAGFKAEQINAVLLTHIHPDHIGGLVKNKQLVFPNAMVYISKAEADFWLNPGNKQGVAEEQKSYFDVAAAVLIPVRAAGKLKTFLYGEELFLGILPISSPGHTPGHSFYSVESKGEKIIFVGDLSLSEPVQFTNPKVMTVYDYNPIQAASTRINELKDASDKGYLIGVSHNPFPGIGNVRANEKGFTWYPINYTNRNIEQQKH